MVVFELFEKYVMLGLLTSPRVSGGKTSIEPRK